MDSIADQGAAAGGDTSHLAQDKDIEWQTFHGRLAPFPHSFHLANQHTVTATQIQKLKTSLQSALSVGYKTSLETARAKNFLAYLLVRQELTQEALRQTEEALKQEGQRYNLVSLANKAVILWHMGRRQEAEAQVHCLYHIKTMRDFEYFCVRAKAELAFCYSRMGPDFFPTAISVFNEVLVTARKPDTWLWTFGLGLSKRRALHQRSRPEQVHGEERQVYFDILRLFQKVIRNTKRADLQAKAYAEIALLAHRTIDKELKRDLVTKAGISRLQACEQALRISGDDNSVLCKAGKVFRQAKDLGRAIFLLEKAVSIRPSSTGYTQLGLAYRELAEKSRLNDDTQRYEQFTEKRRSKRHLSKHRAGYTQFGLGYPRVAEIGGDEGSRLNDDRQWDQQFTEKGRSQRYRGKGHEPEHKVRSQPRISRVVDRGQSLATHTADGMGVASMTHTPTCPSEPDRLAPPMTSVPGRPPFGAVLEIESCLPMAESPLSVPSRMPITPNPPSVTTSDFNAAKEKKYLKTVSRVTDETQPYVLIMGTPPSFCASDPSISKAIHYLKRAIEVSEGENIWAKKSLADIYVSLQEHDNALEIFGGIRNSKRGPVETDLLIEFLEQIAPILTLKCRMNDEGQKKELTKQAEHLFYTTLMKRAQSVSQSFGAGEGEMWESLSVLLTTVDQFEQTAPREKTAVAKFLRFISKGRQFLPLFKEIPEIIPFEEDPQSVKSCIEHLVQEVEATRRRKDYDKTLALIELLMCTSRGQAAMQLFNDPQYVQKLYVAAGKHALCHKPSTAKMYFQSAFVSSVKDVKPEATDAEDAETWNLMLIHDDGHLPKNKASTLASILRDACGLAVTRQDEDAGRDRASALKGMMHVMDRCQLVMVLAGDRQTRHVGQLVSHAARRKSTVVLLTEGDYVHEELTEHRRMVCPPELLQPKDTHSGKYSKTTIRAICQIFTFLIDTELPDFKKGSKDVVSSPESPNEDCVTQTTENLSSHGSSSIRAAQDARPKTSATVRAYRTYALRTHDTAPTGRTDRDANQESVELDKSRYASEDSESETTAKINNDGTLCSADLDVGESESCSRSPATFGSPSSCVSYAQTNCSQTPHFLQFCPASTLHKMIPDEDTTRSEVLERKRSGTRTPVDKDTMSHTAHTELSSQDCLSHSKNEPPICSPRWQAVYSVSRDGGIFCKQSSDVTLCIPAGSVASQGSAVDIYTAVSTDIDLIWRTLGLSEEETVCSPLVEYSTNQEFRGFQKPVCINLPLFLPPDPDPQLVRVYRVAHRPHGKVAVSRLRQKNTGCLFPSATQIMRSRSREATSGGQQLIKVIPHQQPHPQKDGQAFSTQSQSDPSRVPGTDQPPPESVGNPDTETLDEADQVKVGPNHTLRKQRADETLSTRSAIATETLAAGPTSVEESSQLRDSTDYPPWEDGAHFQLRSDSTVCITTDHFSGYVCTYCGRHQGPPVLIVLACGSHTRDPGGQQTATIAVHIWDKRIDIADFREDYGIGFRGQELNRTTLNLVDDLRESLLYVRLVITGRNKADWQHSVGDDDQPSIPIQQQHDLKRLLSCNYDEDCRQSTRSSQPITTSWVLELLADCHPGQWFRGTVSLCNVAATASLTWSDRMKIERTTSLPIEVEAIQRDSKRNGTDEAAWRHDLLDLTTDKLDAIVQKLGYSSSSLRSVRKGYSSEEDFKQKLISICVSSETNIKRLPGILISLLSQNQSDTTTSREAIGIGRRHNHSGTPNNIKSASVPAPDCSHINFNKISSDIDEPNDFIPNNSKTKLSLSFTNSQPKLEPFSHVKPKLQACTSGSGDKDMYCVDWLTSQASSGPYRGPGPQSILDGAPDLSSLSGYAENQMNNLRGSIATDVDTYADNMWNDTAEESSTTSSATFSDNMAASANGSSDIGVATAPPQQPVRQKCMLSQSLLNPNASPFCPRK